MTGSTIGFTVVRPVLVYRPIVVTPLVTSLSHPSDAVVVIDAKACRVAA